MSNCIIDHDGDSMSIDLIDATDARGDEMAAQAEFHYWHTVQSIAGLLFVYGYDKVMADVNDALLELERRHNADSI